MKKYAILYKIKIKHWLVLKSFARLNYIPFFFIFSHLCIIIEYSSAFPSFSYYNGNQG